MIEYRELHVGSFVRSGSRVCKVTAVSEIHVKTTAGEPAMEQLEAILLDGIWMKYFTGDDTGNLVLSVLERSTTSSDIIILSTVECYLHDDGFLRVCAYEYEKQDDGTSNISDDVIILGYKHIRYVHQLQHLYSVLAGKELEGQGDIPG